MLCVPKFCQLPNKLESSFIPLCSSSPASPKTMLGKCRPWKRRTRYLNDAFMTDNRRRSSISVLVRPAMLGGRQVLARQLAFGPRKKEAQNAGAAGCCIGRDRLPGPRGQAGGKGGHLLPAFAALLPCG